MERMRRQRWRNRLTLLGLLGLLLLSVACATAQPVTEADYQTETIALTGLSDQEQTISVEELLKLDCVSEAATAARHNGEKVRVEAYGPTLQTLMKKYGRSLDEYVSVRFVAKDRYSISVPKEILESRPIVLACLDGKQALAAEDRPVRVVVPGERAMYWVRMLERIDFEKDTRAAQARRMIILDTALADEAKTAVAVDGKKVPVYELKALLKRYADQAGDRTACLTAGDGLKKNETIDNVRSAYLVPDATGLRFYSPEFPEGMSIDGLRSLQAGETVMISLAEYRKTKEEPLRFDALAASVAMADCAHYACAAAGQQPVLLTADQVANAELRFSAGQWMLVFGAAADQAIAGILTIEGL